MSKRVYSRFAGEVEPVSCKIWRRSDPRFFRFLVSGEFPRHPLPESDEEIKARQEAHYSEDERLELFTPARRKILEDAGPIGKRIVALIDSGSFASSDSVGTDSSPSEEITAPLSPHSQ